MEKDAVVVGAVVDVNDGGGGAYVDGDCIEVLLSVADVSFSVAEGDPASSSWNISHCLVMTAALLLAWLASVNSLACFPWL